MRYNVSQLLKEPVGATRGYTVAEWVNLPEDDQATPVEGEVRLLRTDRGVLVTCDLKTVAAWQCSRCLAAFRQQLRIRFEEEYFPLVDIGTGARLEAPDAEAFMLDEHHILDLREAFRQYRIMNTPMQPLCREACAGICADCGADLNQEACACGTSRVDPRWSPLVGLRSRLAN